MKTCKHITYFNWKTVGASVALLKILFNNFFGEYFELILHIIHLPSIYYGIIALNLASCICWLIGIFIEKTICMLLPLLWWLLVMSPFVWLAIFDAIYDNDSYSIRINPYYAMTASIVAWYLVAVICYMIATKAENNKYSPESSETSDVPESYTATEKNLVAYI